MSFHRSLLRSRCSCGHHIIRDNPDSPWRHVEPHPAHACPCTDPKPGDIGHFPKTEARVQAGISTTGTKMLRREGYAPGESR